MKALLILWCSFVFSIEALAICPQISGNFLCGEKYKEPIYFRSAIINNVQKYKIDGLVKTVNTVSTEIITDDNIFTTPKKADVKLQCENSTIVKYIGYLDQGNGQTFFDFIKVTYSIDDFGDLSVLKESRRGASYELISQTSCIRSAQ